MKTTRRSFLKMVGIAAGASALGVPAALKLVSGPEQTVVGMVRELIGYSIVKDQVIVRHDIRTKDLQLGVDAWLEPGTGDQFYAAGDLDAARSAAVEALESELAKRGLSAADLVELPQPAAYELNLLNRRA